MRRITLAPSDFAYLLHECPRCWWLKTRKLAPFKEPFPKTFQDIDRAMKSALSPQDQDDGQWLETLRALGVPVSECVPLETVASQPIEFDDFGVAIELYGRLDRAYRDSEGGVCIIDFKTGDTSSALKVGRFSEQLHSYQWCMEHPKSGSPVEVTRLGIVTFSPGGMKLAKADNDFGLVRCAFSGMLSYKEIPIDRATFYESSLRKAALLAAPDELPRPGEGCARCYAVAEVLKYQQSHAKRTAQKEAA